jgi:hypothetical protein
MKKLAVRKHSKFIEICLKKFRMSTLSFLISPHVKVSEDDLWSLVGRDELHIEKAPTSPKDQIQGENNNKYSLR